MIAGFCKCGSPAHVEYYGVLYCYECGRKAIAERKKARESARAGGDTAGAVDRADTEDLSAKREDRNGEGKP